MIFVPMMVGQRFYLATNLETVMMNYELLFTDGANRDSLIFPHNHSLVMGDISFVRGYINCKFNNCK